MTTKVPGTPVVRTIRSIACGGGVELAVELAGEGKPLLLLHGFTGSTEAMAPIADLLVAKRLVISVDLVGHGKSSSPSDLAHYTMSAVDEQLIAVLDSIEAPKVDVLGYSMGGRVALSLACAHPDRVGTVCAVGARAGFADPDERAERIAADERLADELVADGLEAFVDRWMALPLFATQQRLGREALAWSRQLRLGNSVVGLANSLRGMGSGAMPPLHHQLQFLLNRVEIIVGAEDDRFLPVATELEQLLPNASVFTIPDAGHAAHLEQPAAVADLLLD